MLKVWKGTGLAVGTRHDLGVLVRDRSGLAESWHKKKFPDWSGSDVQKIPTDSPWARPVLIPVATIGGGSGKLQAA